MFDYGEYLKKVAEAQHGNMRRGQCMFNVLHTMSPELANTIRGSELDPFYDDSKIDAFLDWLFLVLMAINGRKQDNDNKNRT